MAEPVAASGKRPDSRCLGRGLATLGELNRRRIATAAEIGSAIGVPRPTVHRLLLALVAEGYVRQLEATKFFTPLSRVAELSSGWDAAARALEIAARLIDDLARTVEWPIDLAMFDDGAMILRHSTHDRAGWSLMRRSPVGRRIPMCGTAPGRMFLAGLDHAHRAPFLADATPDERQAIEMAARCGFAIRDGGVMPRTTSIAVPIVADGVTLLCVSMAFIRASIPLQQAIATHVPTLTGIARHVERQLGEAPAHAIDDPLAGRLAPPAFPETVSESRTYRYRSAG